MVFTGTNSGLISTTDGTITFNGLKITSAGTYQFEASSNGLTSGLSSSIIITPFSVVSIQLTTTITSISAYFSFTITVSLVNEIGALYRKSADINLTADLEFGGALSLTTSTGTGDLSVYGKQPGLITFNATCNNIVAAKTITINSNILKFEKIDPAVIYN